MWVQLDADSMSCINMQKSIRGQASSSKSFIRKTCQLNEPLRVGLKCANRGVVGVRVKDSGHAQRQTTKNNFSSRFVIESIYVTELAPCLHTNPFLFNTHFTFYSTSILKLLNNALVWVPKRLGSMLKLMYTFYGHFKPGIDWSLFNKVIYLMSVIWWQIGCGI